MKSGMQKLSVDSLPYGTSAGHWWYRVSSSSSSAAETNEVRYAENDICGWKGPRTLPLTSALRWSAGSSSSRFAAQADEVRYGTYAAAKLYTVQWLQLFR